MVHQHRRPVLSHAFEESLSKRSTRLVNSSRHSRGIEDCNLDSVIENTNAIKVAMVLVERTSSITGNNYLCRR